MSFQVLDQVSSQNLPDTPKTKKFRLSCDGCLGAKVKCSKHRPVCSRCASQDTPCVYSESRRAGRRGIKLEGNTQARRESSKPAQTNLPASDQSAGTRINWEDDMWPLYANSTADGSRVPSQTPTGHCQFDTQTSSATSLDSMFQTAPPSTQSRPTDIPTPMSLGFLNLASPDTKPMSDWIKDLEQPSYQGSYSTGSQSPIMTTGSIFHSGFTPDCSTFSDSSMDTDANPIPCSCLSALQEKFNGLNLAVPPFDQFIAVTKSAVACMTHCLSCNCLPDISSVMLFSLIITRLVQWHKQISKGDCQASIDVGVTMGRLKIDREDEYQIKRMLIRSELVKIRALIDQFRVRFESYLLGTERQVYEASVEFLEAELNTTIEDL